MKAESSSVSIVLLGRFQPDAFLPDKLVQGKVISKKLADDVSYLSLLPGQQVQYKFAWGELLAQRGRLQITTTDAPYIRICDFINKAIDEVAPESSVSAFGINRDSHYDFQNSLDRNKVGVRLSPPDAWGAWGTKIRESMENELAGTNRQGGIILIQMRLPFDDGVFSGWRDVTVSPSPLIPKSGILIRANHHHQIADDASTNDDITDSPDGAVSSATSKLLANLANSFDASIAESESIFKGVLTP